MPASTEEISMPKYQVDVILSMSWIFDTTDVPEDFTPQDGEEALWDPSDPNSVQDYIRDRLDDGTIDPNDEGFSIDDIKITPKK
jgi:hypothetical protein